MTEVSLRDVYVKSCDAYGCKKNSYLLKALPTGPGQGDFTQLDLNLNFVGRNGVKAVLDVVKESNHLQKLCLADNFLNNESVKKLVQCIEANQQLTYLDLSRNPISHVSGKALSNFLDGHHNVVDLLLDDTLINPALVRIIQRKVDSNRTPTPGPTPEPDDNNDVKMPDRVVQAPAAERRESIGERREEPQHHESETNRQQQRPEAEERREEEEPVPVSTTRDPEPKGATEERREEPSQQDSAPQSQLTPGEGLQVLLHISQPSQFTYLDLLRQSTGGAIYSGDLPGLRCLLQIADPQAPIQIFREFLPHIPRTYTPGEALSLLYSQASPQHANIKALQAFSDGERATTADTERRGGDRPFSPDESMTATTLLDLVFQVADECGGARDGLQLLRQLAEEDGGQLAPEESQQMEVYTPFQTGPRRMFRTLDLLFQGAERSDELRGDPALGHFADVIRDTYDANMMTSLSYRTKDIPPALRHLFAVSPDELDSVHLLQEAMLREKEPEKPLEVLFDTADPTHTGLALLRAAADPAVTIPASEASANRMPAVQCLLEASPGMKNISLLHEAGKEDPAGPWYAMSLIWQLVDTDDTTENWVGLTSVISLIKSAPL